MVHLNNSKNLNDIRTRLVIDIIVLGGVGWVGFMSYDSAAGGSQMLVLQLIFQQSTKVLHFLWPPEEVKHLFQKTTRGERARSKKKSTIEISTPFSLRKSHTPPEKLKLVTRHVREAKSSHSLPKRVPFSFKENPSVSVEEFRPLQLPCL